MVNTDSEPSSGLDEIDHQIIAILQQDGRVPFAQIAEQLNVSAGMIRLRYNRLAEMGVLWRSRILCGWVTKPWR
jgi:Lrp/AsnC family transcriptional regulator for asnA, asnC and gidA